MKRLSTLLVAVTLAAVASPVMAAPLPDAPRAALEAALQDEHQAEAIYAAVIAKFGQVRPFSNIIVAERMHAAELAAVMLVHGIDATNNKLLRDPAIAAQVPATLAEACALGVKAEIANKDLYDKTLIPAAAGYPDIIAVFTRLRDASQNNHLPAFQRCGGGGRPGMGRLR
jgi:hypothetical protein